MKIKKFNEKLNTVDDISNLSSSELDDFITNKYQEFNILLVKEKIIKKIKYLKFKMGKFFPFFMYLHYHHQ